jgi:glucuronoarabinoxylan endo-1,4-beta-xylanase
MQMAQARGAKVWSTPWSPQASFKSTNALGVTSINGGSFVSANYQVYANQLAGYVVGMKNNYGVNLYAISVQNEPDVDTTNYESCVWTPQQIHDFVPYLKNALAASNVSPTKIMLAEDENWQTNYYSTTMNDVSVATNVGIVACHNYDGSPPSGSPAALSNYSNTNAALWETEVSTFDAFDGSITNAIYWAGRIHLFMTAAQANAFHYWWLVPYNSDNQGLTDQSGNPARRMYALGNFSRFVRPNFYRIGVTNTLNSTLVSAYKDSISPGFVIVAINPNNVAINQTFNLTNGIAAGSVTPWITSGNLSLSNQPAVGVTNSSFTYALPAMSVVTFVGQAYAVPTNIVIAGATYKNHAFVLTWNATPGAIYSVLKTNVLAGAAANWPDVITSYPVGGAAAGSISYTDATASLSRNFYRVTSP